MDSLVPAYVTIGIMMVVNVTILLWVNYKYLKTSKSININSYSHQRSVTPGNVPKPKQVNEGEMAVQLADLKIFTRDHNGNVVVLARNVDKELRDLQDRITLLQRDLHLLSNRGGL